VGGDVYARRVTVLVGHFGSGKTEIAINGALDLVALGRRPVLVDLDVVKPYFRSRSARHLMHDRGVRVIAPEGENVYADLPVILPEIRTLLRDASSQLILDAGGDPTGARVLGSLMDAIADEETDTLAVLNFRRPFTESVDDALTMVRQIEAASRRRVTGVVSNTHLMTETTPALVVEGYELTCTTAARLGVRVAAVAADEELLPKLDAEVFECQVLPLRRIVKPPFEISGRQRATGPLFVLN
jgi:hypothetical protein